MSYYDVFVRHAFGNYRDVLREIGYTDLMANWLSFLDNKSVQYHINADAHIQYPDENFAREIMQLFSIGIYQLNMDGTKKLDDDGVPLLTYDSDDIMSFARAWTGFV